MINQNRWNKLDNAAKIFPPNASSRDTKVFRFTCELTENVDSDALQRALEQTLSDFPLYKCVLKKGFFWYYLEESEIIPQVFEESLPMCSPIYSPDKPGLLFRVMYYKKRINLEIFHALTDGSGATLFTRSLIAHYLAEKHKLTEHITDIDASVGQKGQDAFHKNNQSFEDVLKSVRESLKEQLTQVRLSGIIKRYSAIENNLLIKAVLLLLKIPALALAGFLATVEETATFSNIGKIHMPQAASKHIKLFSVFISTRRPQMSVCSFEDTLSVSLTSQLADTGIERRFVRSLASMGLDVSVVSNMEQVYGEYEQEDENAAV